MVFCSEEHLQAVSKVNMVKTILASRGREVTVGTERVENDIEMLTLTLDKSKHGERSYAVGVEKFITKHSSWDVYSIADYVEKVSDNFDYTKESTRTEKIRQIFKTVELRLCNTERNKDWLCDARLTNFMDLTIYYIAKVDGRSIVLTNKDFEESELNEWEVFQDAYSNTFRESPLYVKKTHNENKTSGEAETVLSEWISDKEVEENQGVCVTKKHGDNGCVLMLNQHFLNRFHKRFGDFYIAPTSRDAIYFIPKKYLRKTHEDMSPIKRLSEGLMYSNFIKSPILFLSDNIYECNGEMLEIVKEVEA